MLLYIERKGSGWGGAYGRWIVDIKSRVAYNVYNLERKPILLPDVSLLTLLCDCELHQSYTARLDQQQDYVWVLTPGKQTCVLNTDIDLYPANEALHGKLLKLIEYLN